VLAADLREGESADPYWMQKSGLAAGRLLEEQQRWQEAERVYLRLAEWLPSLRGELEKRLAQIRSRGSL